MRNVFIIGLLVFIAVASGGYAISWYAQASATKESIENIIAKINGKQKYITYEAIEASGFPSKVNVSIIKPRFQGRMDELLREMHKEGAAPGTPPAKMIAWEEDAMLDGKIIFGINAMSDHYSLTISGNWHETAKIDGQTYTHHTQQASDLTCILNFQRSAGIFDTLWDYNQLNRDGKELVKDFRALDCNTMGQTTMDAQTREPLSSSGMSRLYITSTPQSPNHQLRFYMKVADMQVTPLGDARMAHYLRAASPGYPIPYAFSAYGKQNIDIDFTYYGPTEAGSSNPPVDITVNKFDIINQVYTFTMAFRFNNTPKANERTTAVYLKSEAAFSEQYDVMMHDVVRGVIQQMYNPADANKEIQAALRKYTPEQTYAIVYPVIPKLHPMGRIVTAVDAGFQGTENFASGMFNLNAFEISMAPYAITGKGEIKTAPGLLPSGNLYIACSNCLAIIDDINDYTLRLQRMISYFDPEKAATMTVNMAQAEGLKRFLNVLGATQQDGSGKPLLVFNIVSAGSNTSINGKNMNEVLVLYNEYMRPHQQ